MATPIRPPPRPRPTPASWRTRSPSSRRRWSTSGPRIEPVVVGAVRERLPRRRTSSTFAFRVADCEGYVTVGEYEDGRPGEVFMKVSKQGSTLAGIMDAFSISVSLGLQHGVPLATYVRKYTNMQVRAGRHHRRPGAAHRHQPGRLHLPAPGRGLPHPRRAGRARRALDGRADAADPARGRGDGDTASVGVVGAMASRRGTRSPPRRAGGPTGATPVQWRANRRSGPRCGTPPTATVRQRHAAGGLVLRVRAVAGRRAAARSQDLKFEFGCSQTIARDDQGQASAHPAVIVPGGPCPTHRGVGPHRANRDDRRSVYFGLRHGRTGRNGPTDPCWSMAG